MERSYRKGGVQKSKTINHWQPMLNGMSALRSRVTRRHTSWKEKNLPQKGSSIIGYFCFLPVISR